MDNLTQEVRRLRRENPALAQMEKERQEKEAKEYPRKKTP